MPPARFPPANTVLHYRRQYYDESSVTASGESSPAGGPRGLVGREVANSQWLHAFLRFGRQRSLDFLLHETPDQASLQAKLARLDLSQRRIRVGPLTRADDWLGGPVGQVLWQPQPPSASWSWTRQRLSKTPFALCGVAHALCSASAIGSIRDLVTSPIQSFDRLVCPSRAVQATASEIMHHWADTLAAGHGSRPREGVRTEVIPLGVDTDHHSPPTRPQRDQARTDLGIPPDADVVLFVGRLSHHAKANPITTFASMAAAARQTGRPTVLVMAGWFANASIEKAYRETAASMCRNMRVLFVDATESVWRDRIWHAADVFISLSDSVQETFGLTVIEASSRGLPVIASDFNGYRDTIVEGRTGYRIPTIMIRGVGQSALTEMLEERISYDQCLARIGQGVVVDPQATRAALVELLSHPEKRAAMGRAGRDHAIENYAWPKIIGRYEALWEEQRSQLNRAQGMVSTRVVGEGVVIDDANPVANETQMSAKTAVIPETIDELQVDRLFMDYPSSWLDRQTTVVLGEGSCGNVEFLWSNPISGHSVQDRVDIEQAVQCLAQVRDSPGPVPVNALARGSEPTMAWAMKFDLLRSSDAVASRDLAHTQQAQPKVRHDEPWLTLSTTCMGRLSHLQATLPHWATLPNCRIVVVDYSCPDGCGNWVREHFDPSKVSVVTVAGRTRFDRSEAKNRGIEAATTPWVCVIDADITPAPAFVDVIESLVQPGKYLRSSAILEGTGGTFIAQRQTLIDVGMHDVVYQGWGEEDDDLLDALYFAGITADVYPDRLLDHIDHADDLRTQFHDQNDRRVSHMVNRIYRAAKWDLARMANQVPSLARRQTLYADIADQLHHAIDHGEPVDIRIATGQMNWVPLAAACERELHYRIEMDPTKDAGQYAKKE